MSFDCSAANVWASAVMTRSKLIFGSTYIKNAGLPFKAKNTKDN